MRIYLHTITIIDKTNRPHSIISTVFIEHRLFISAAIQNQISYILKGFPNRIFRLLHRQSFHFRLKSTQMTKLSKANVLKSLQ